MSNVAFGTSFSFSLKAPHGGSYSLQNAFKVLFRMRNSACEFVYRHTYCGVACRRNLETWEMHSDLIRPLKEDRHQTSRRLAITVLPFEGIYSKV